MAQLARRRPTKHRQGSRRKNALPISSILQKKKAAASLPLELPFFYRIDDRFSKNLDFLGRRRKGNSNTKSIGKFFFELLQY